MDPQADLAVLTVKAKDLPVPIDPGSKPAVRETMRIYTLGFPQGDAPAVKQNERRPATLVTATITSLRHDEQRKLSIVQIDGKLSPGCSGSPVVDADGKLVGIVKAKIKETNLNFAIPACHLRKLIDVQAKSTLVRTTKVTPTTTELNVELPFDDLLSKAKSATLRYGPAELRAAQLQADEEGAWPAIPRAEQVACKIEGKKALATLTVRTDEKKKAVFVFQLETVQSDGRTVLSQPTPRQIAFEENAVAGPMSFEPLAFKGHTDWIVGLIVAPDGGLISASHDRSIRFWNLQTGRLDHVLDASASVECLALSPDGKTLACGTHFGLQLWDVAKRKNLLADNPGREVVRTVAYHRDSRTVALTTYGAQIYFWDSDNRRKFYEWNSGMSVNCLAYHPDGKVLASAGGLATVGEITLWSAANAKEVGSLKGHKSAHRALAFSAEGQTLVSGSEDHSVRVWDPASKKCLLTLEGHTAAVKSVALSPDGKVLAAATNRGDIMFWDLPSGKVRGSVATNRFLTAMIFHPDGGSILAALGSDIREIGLP